mgnify:CR=1 FL=1
MDDKYKIVLTEASKLLKEFGFKKRGNNFLIDRENNIGIINFQKSQNSNSSCTIFTINLGVYCTALKVLDPMEIKSKPMISDCHWKIRIGFLSHHMRDYWWKVDESTSLNDLGTEIALLLKDKAVPEILNHITDESLMKYWMNGVTDGLSEQQMDIYLVAMLKEYNNPLLKSKIIEIKGKYKGKPFYNNIKENFSKLGITYE